MSIRATVDTCIDGSVSTGTIKFSVDMDIKTDLAGPEGKKVQLTATGRMTGEEVQKPLPAE